MAEKIIKIENLSMCYKPGVSPSLSNINLEINKGECIALVGRSGCGKTSLLRCMNGLAQHYYESECTGNIYVSDENISESTLGLISQKVGSLFQNPRSQFFNVDTSAELVFGCENLGIDREKILHRINGVVNELNLSNLVNRNIFELSGGEKQKVALASLIAMDPEVYMLDEVSSNLDISEVGKLKEILIRLKDKGKTIVLSEHRMYWLCDLVDRYILMDKGKITHIYSKKEMLKLSEKQLENIGIRPFKLMPKSKIQSPLKSNSISFDNFCSIRSKGHYIKMDNTKFEASVIGVIGKNGCGKSTFIEGILGFLKAKGNVYINSSKLNYTNCAYVMQDVSKQLFSETVLNEVLLGSNENKDVAINILDSLSLGKKIEYHPQSLSGGEKQRVSIATCIYSNKGICFMDEPTSGLDYISMINLTKLINELKSKGTLVILVTHDFELLDLCCDYVIEIDNNRAKGYKYNGENMINKFMSWFNEK